MTDNPPGAETPQIAANRAAAKYIGELEARLEERNESATTWEWVMQSLRKNADHAVIVTLLPDGNTSFLHGNPVNELERAKAELRGQLEAAVKEVDRQKTGVEELRKLFNAQGELLVKAESALAEREAVEAEVERLAQIGREWEADSSLEKWFPITAEQLSAQAAALASERERCVGLIRPIITDALNLTYDQRAYGWHEMQYVIDQLERALRGQGRAG